MTVSIRAYSRHRRVSEGAVRKAIRAGRIKVEADGTIDPVKADAAWDRNTNPALQRKQAAPKKKSEPPPVSTPLPSPPQAGKSASAIPAYQTSRAVRETFAAKLTKLDFEERTKTLVRADEVRVAAFDTARRVRDRLFCIPPRLAAVLAAETDAHTVEQMLQEAIRDALEELNRSSPLPS